MKGRGTEVGVRELKATLSAQLRGVRNGGSVTVTDRGRPVAKIIPAGLPEGLERMIRDGTLVWGGRKPTLPRRHKLPAGGPSLSDVVIEMRRERDEALQHAIGSRSHRRRP